MFEVILLSSATNGTGEGLVFLIYHDILRIFKFVYDINAIT